MRWPPRTKRLEESRADREALHPGIERGGRGGSGVSTYIESLDGQFSIRVTHNQVGPNPIGNPPAPRIHIYEGQVSGHGTHIVLPNGTTLDDILRALHLL